MAASFEDEPKLNETDRKILGKLSLGQTNLQIAQLLSLSDGFVGKRLSEIYEILGVPNRAAAAIWYKNHAEKENDLSTQVSLPNPQKNHKVSILTGLTCSGKDTALIYIYDKILQQSDPEKYHFPDKYITRPPRPEERLSTDESTRRTVPYGVVPIKREDIESNLENFYLNVYNRYGNIAAFGRQDFIDALSTKNSKHIIFINPDITRIEHHKHEVEDICLALNKQKAWIPQIKVQVILLDTDPITCAQRLKARGIEERVRSLRRAQMQGDYSRILELKKSNFFDHIVGNTNDNAINSTLEILFNLLSIN